MLYGLRRVGTTFTAGELSAWCIRRRTERHATPRRARPNFPRHALKRHPHDVDKKLKLAFAVFFIPCLAAPLPAYAVPKSPFIEIPTFVSINAPQILVTPL